RPRRRGRRHVDLDAQRRVEEDLAEAAPRLGRHEPRCDHGSQPGSDIDGSQVDASGVLLWSPYQRQPIAERLGDLARNGELHVLRRARPFGPEAAPARVAVLAPALRTTEDDA